MTSKNIDHFIYLLDCRENLSNKIDKLYDEIFDLNTSVENRKKLVKKFDRYISKYLILCKEIENYTVLK